ncbi:putative acetyltransferase [Prauserella halophila]|nr:putative acetyltransferase [Prauserella halophila]
MIGGMTDHDVRTLADDELRTAQDLFRSTLHVKPITDEEWPQVRAAVQDGPTLGVTDGESGALIGTARSFESAMTLPGGAGVPIGGVTHVGVRADRTRRGVLTELMHAQLTDLAERGMVAAGLHASETSIYGRFGYGVATCARDYTVDRRFARFRSDAPVGGRVEIRTVEAAIELFADAYPRTATRPGMLTRPAGWWAQLRRTLERQDGPVTAITHEGADGVDGYAVYSVDRPQPGPATLRLVDLQCAGPESFAGLWRYLLSVDLVHDITASGRPLDEPLELLLTDPRAVSTIAQFDDLWLRLIDVPTALAMRTYAGESLVLDVTDPVLPGNDGCYRVGPDGAARTEDPAALHLDVDALAMIYLGAWRPSQLVDTGRVRASTPGAARQADRLFATSAPPWCGTFF